jgi:hypothetical protein
LPWAIDRVLQRLHIARGAVVEDAQHVVGADAARRLDLADRHVEAAIAGQAHHAARRPGGHLRAHRPRRAVADGGEAAIGDEVPPGALRVEQQPAPMPGEAAIGDQDVVLRPWRCSAR